jgi:hypothetical protein
MDDDLEDALNRLARERSAAKVSTSSWSRVIASLLAGIYVVSAFTRSGQLVLALGWIILLVPLTEMAFWYFEGVGGAFP